MRPLQLLNCYKTGRHLVTYDKRCVQKNGHVICLEKLLNYSYASYRSTALSRFCLNFMPSNYLCNFKHLI
jgi:hypothetical protein